MAYNYAIKENDRINKVVCLEGGIVTQPIKSIIWTLGMMFPEILIPTQKNMTKILKKLCSPNSNFIERYPDVVEHLILVMKNHNQKAMFVHKLEKYEKEKGRAIKDKILFLLGDHFINQRKDFYAIMENDGHNYKFIKNAGHAINHEQPEMVDREIINFLKT